MSPTFAVLAPLLTATVALAAAPERPRVPPPVALAPAPWTQVLTDVGDDGTVFARGAGWKLVAASDGATWMPVLGARAPRSPRLALTPVRATIGGRALELATRAPPQLEGARITYARGPWLERYDLRPSGIEQSFVLDQFPGDGDLELELGTGSELSYLGRDGGLVFDADGRARVRYSDVTVVDAAGARTELDSSWTGTHIALRIPAAVLAQATYPLVIDPLIGAFDVDVDTGSDGDPAIAFTNGVFLIVHEDASNAADRDLIATRFDANGAFLDTVAVDLSTADSFDPAVAGANTTFMAAWIEKSSAGADPIVRARRRTATNTAQGAAFDVSAGSTAEAHCDIGASPNPVTHPFFVVWQQAGAQGDVVGRGVTSAGGLAPVLVLSNDQNDQIQPSISSFAGANGIWLAAWETVQPNDRRVIHRGINDDGTALTGPTTSRINPFGVACNPDVDGDGANWILAFEIADPNQPSGRDIGANLMIHAPTINPAIIPQDFNINLTKLELGATESFSQTNPIVAAEGNRFTYAYRSKTSLIQTQPSLLTASFAFDPVNGDEFVFTETSAGVASGLLSSPTNAALTSTRFQSVGRIAFAWEESPLSTPDVVGQLRSVLGTGGVTITQTGCGSPEPLLAFSGTPALGATLTMTPIGATNPLLAIGPPVSLSLCPGQATCILGANPLLLFAAPFGIAGPIPQEPSLIGFTVAAQIIDVLPTGSPGSNCAPPFFTQTFRVSDTRVITFQ